MESIIVGVDGSESASRAAQAAADLAHKTGSRLHVVTAYGNARAEAALKDSASDWQALAAQAAADTAASSARRLAQEFPGVTITSGSAHGKPHTVLVEEAERVGADLIVVGNRRVQGVQRVLGSIASAVAHRAHCDVYIAHTTG
jgi:nucleotide-binding universal stress UspA family protein